MESGGDPELVGIRKASTFAGFCGYHDTIAFARADQATAIDTEIAFLLSYRSLCFEVAMKKVAEDTLRYCKALIDRGQSFESQVLAQEKINEAIYLMNIGFREHLRRKVEWDRLLVARSYANFSYRAIRLPDGFPMLGSGTFLHEYDFSGRYLQPPGKYLHRYDMLAFNFCNFGAEQVLVFGWMASEASGAAFVQSFEELPESRKWEALVRFSWDITDNLYLRPSWWDKKSRQEQRALAAFGLASLPGSRSALALVPTDDPLFR